MNNIYLGNLNSEDQEFVKLILGSEVQHRKESNERFLSLGGSESLLTFESIPVNYSQNKVLGEEVGILPIGKIITDNDIVYMEGLGKEYINIAQVNVSADEKNYLEKSKSFGIEMVLSFNEILGPVESFVGNMASEVGFKFDNSNIESKLLDMSSYPSDVYPELVFNYSPNYLDTYKGIPISGNDGLYHLINEDLYYLNQSWYVLDQQTGTYSSPISSWRSNVLDENSKINNLKTDISNIKNAINNNSKLSSLFSGWISSLNTLDSLLTDLQTHNNNDYSIADTWETSTPPQTMIDRKNFLNSFLSNNLVTDNYPGTFSGLSDIYDNRWFWITFLIHRRLGTFSRYNNYMNVYGFMMDDIDFYNSLNDFIQNNII